MRWHVLTGEYPPQSGGVSDYTRLVACELARAGDQVHVWSSQNRGQQPADNGVEVHRLPGHFGPSALAILDRAIAADHEHRLLVQYVPHAFGWKAMNLFFCAWLFARRRLDITVMFHEVLFPRDSRLAQHKILATVTSLMARLTANSARRVFVSCCSWEKLLRPILCTGQAITWLPVPSNVPVIDDAPGTSAIRSRYAPNKVVLLGHFGTYSTPIRKSLEAVLPMLTEQQGVSVLLLGRGSRVAADEFVQRNPRTRHRIRATDALSGSKLSLHLSACDLMLQPYPDGISTRRTSAMAALAHGRAVVTTLGALTEAIWAQSGAVAMSPASDTLSLVRSAATLIADEGERERLGRAGRELYERCFDLRHTVAQLRAS